MEVGDSGLEFETGEVISFLGVEYGDLDGDGVAEAIVQLSKAGCGRGGMDNHYLYVMALDARCTPVQRSSEYFDACGKRKLVGKTITVDRSECYGDTKPQRWQLVGGKLQQAR